MDNEQKHQEREDLVNLKRAVEPELQRLEEIVLTYKPQDNDQDSDDLISRAAYYRDILIRINLDLTKLNKS